MFFNNKDSHNEFHHPNQGQRINAYKIQAKNAVALSLFTTLLISGAASAGTMGDYENNNSTANQTGVFYGANAVLNVNGTVSNTDTTDLYSIKDEGSLNKIDWSFHSNSNATRMYVFKDVNRNKKYDSSDAILFHMSNKENYKSYYSFKGAMYVVMVARGSTASGQKHYYMNASSPKTVKLNVISAKNYGKFDNGNNKPDFYVKTQIYHFRRLKSKTIGNNNTPVFNHVHEETHYPERGFIPFSIDLYDSDGRSKDDQADIHPNPKLKRLDLVYDLYRNQIKTDDGRVLGKPGQAITVKGDRPGNSQASVTFIVR